MGKSFSLIWAVLGISFTLWLFYSYQSHNVDETVWKSNSAISVHDDPDYYSFIPKAYKEVVLFYPGALVEPDAYAPLCRKIAESDYMVILLKMPWRLAKKGYNIPKERNLFADTTKQYILAGHSQGAKMAAQFVHENPGLIDKLILLATTHPRDINLSRIKIPVLKIYGSCDGVANADEIEKNKKKLPAGTKYALIEGANHTQFGYYGFPLGDNRAEISRTVQQRITLDYILSFLRTEYP